MKSSRVSVTVSRTQLVLAFGLLMLLIVGTSATTATFAKQPDAAESLSPEALARVATDEPFIPPGPQIRSEEDLRKDGSLYGPTYWAGRMDGMRYELTVAAGTTFVRYLPDGVDVGDSDTDHLSVATYAGVSGYATLLATAEEDGVTSMTSESGALIVQHPDAPNSVYFSFAGADFQVEVFHPVDGEALSLVQSGRIGLLR